ncbi:PAS domain S-box protein [Geomonas sp. Red32]|uniref:PAS domain S-box protein n=1 Tax=Geomonas sp. Red32 TaxID=2912856 RepID=UPI00202CADA0|nr:PAS domain S-box protein [Geomonas sp. Red32]MCM0082935.1 PAS domain S-box protein [Geomonas sp. Red32]
MDKGSSPAVRRWWHLTVACLAVVAGIVVRDLLEHWFGPGLSPYSLFYPVVLITAMVGGFTSAGLATFLSALFVAYYLLPPEGFGVGAPIDRVGLVVFCIIGAATGLLVTAYRRTKERVSRLEREAALYESRSRLATFAEATFEGIVETRGGIIVDCNDQFAGMLGYPPEELKGNEMAPFIAPEDRERVETIVRASRECIFEHDLIRQDGTRITVEAHGCTISGGHQRHTAVRDITARKAAEEALREAKDQAENERRRLVAILETIPSAVALVNASDRHFSYLNRRACDLYGCPFPGPQPESELARALRPDGTPLSGDELPSSQTFANGTFVRNREMLLERGDGSRIPVLVSSAPLMDAAGGVASAVVVFDDISEIKDAERKRHESESRLRFALEASSIGAWELDLGDLSVARSPEHDRIFGYPELLPRWDFAMFLAHVVEEEREAVERTLRTELAGRESFSFECRIRRRDGELRWIWAAGRTCREGDRERLAGIIQDVTGRKHSEEVLRRYELLAANSRDIILFIRRGDGRILEANAAATLAYGWSREELLERSLMDLRVPGADSETASQMDEADRQGILFETVHRRRDGSLFPVEVSSRGATIGDTRMLVSIVRDITGRKEAEKHLLFQASLLDSVGQAVIATDMSQTLIYWNKAAEALFGWRREEALGGELATVLPPVADPGVEEEVTLALSAGKPCTVEMAVRARDGRVVPMLTTNSPMLDENGLPFAVIGIGTDITDRKRMETELRRSHDELDHRVRERTSELAETVNALLAEIDERERAEEALERTAREVEDLYNLAPCGYHSLDRDSLIVRINDTELKWLGYRRDEVIGRMKMCELVTLASLPDFERAFGRFVSEGGAVTDLRLELRKKDGTVLPVLINSIAVLDENGKYVTNRTSVHDITELIQAEERLRRINQLYLLLSETGKVISRLPSREELYAALCRLAVEYGGFLLAWVGLADEESGWIRPVASFGPYTDYLAQVRVSALPVPEGMGPAGKCIRSGSYYICSDFMSDPDMAPWRPLAERWGFTSVASISINLHGQSLGALTFYAAGIDYFDQDMVELLLQMQADITFALENLEREEKRQQAEGRLIAETEEKLKAMEELREKDRVMLQQSRLAAMGEMISNIAHQWRQPLNTLGLLIQGLPLYYEVGEFSGELLDKTVAQAMIHIQHMSQTIDDFRNFFKPDKELVEFDLDAAVSKAHLLVKESFVQQAIRVDLELSARRTIVGYPNEFAQVLVIILLNARDQIEQQEIDEGRVTVRTFLEGERCVITVADNAGGVPDDIINRIFEPYFSTKGIQGTGIGLYMAKNIVEKSMHGILSVSNRDRGAEFRIEI